MDKILEKLDELIKEGERLSGTIEDTHDVMGFSTYCTKESAKYAEWLASVQRFVRIHHSEELKELEKLVEEAKGRTLKNSHQSILGILKAIKAMPQKMEKAESKKVPYVSINNSLTQNQSQEQNQSLILEIFVEAINDELKGSQRKEIKAILDEHAGEPEKAKSKIIEKLKSFGSDVASNILANIITNPNIWNAF